MFAMMSTVAAATLTGCGAEGPAGTAAVNPQLAEGEPKELGAYITSKHAVYTVGEKIDLTFWVRKPEGPVMPGLEIKDSQGRVLDEKKDTGKSFTAHAMLKAPWGAVIVKRGTAEDGNIAPGAHYLETIPDLREFYDLSQPGEYTVRFVGKEGPPGPALKRLASNAEVTLPLRPVVSKPMTIQVRKHGDPSDAEVPISSVWALDMPGTKPLIRGVPKDAKDKTQEGVLVGEIWRALSQRRPPARAGFAVAGELPEALKEAHEVIVNGRQPRSSFAPAERVNLAFFSQVCGCYVHLARAERRQQVVQLAYRLEPHRDHEMTVHFALVPLANLGKGRFRVDVKGQIGELNGIPVDWIRESVTVCSSFAFEIADR